MLSKQNERSTYVGVDLVNRCFMLSVDPVGLFREERCVVTPRGVAPESKHNHRSHTATEPKRTSGVKSTTERTRKAGETHGVL